METIEIDTDVFAHLKKNARPFDEPTPNSVLRRLLGINGSTAQSRKESPTASNVVGFDAHAAESRPATTARTKAPKAQLRGLVKKGFLQNGQTLYLIDYKGNRVKEKGNRVKEISASISGNSLIYSGQSYSMSKLAQQLLQGEADFGSDSVRGPAHWITNDGETVKDLWRKYLDSMSKK